LFKAVPLDGCRVAFSEHGIEVVGHLADDIAAFQVSEQVVV
jgi:hypothetical protein